MVTTRKSKRQAAKKTGRPNQTGTASNSSPDNAVGGADHVLGGMRGGYRVNDKGVDPDKPDNASNGQTQDTASTKVQSFNIAFGDKSIVCQRHGVTEQQAAEPTTLIFTHGAGGGISNPATQDFVSGFSSVAPTTIAFQGTMNLQSRVKTFAAVLEDVEKESKALSKQNGAYPALGGRSMGARAAVIAANNRQDHDMRPKVLVLVSYPLLGGKGGDEVRDEILNEIAEDVDVLFVSGSKDKMCPLDRLGEIRKGMKTTSWCLIIEGADHGMAMTGSAKRSISTVRKKSGEVAAGWLEKRQREGTVCRMIWAEEDAKIAVGDWKEKDVENQVNADESAGTIEDAAPSKKRKARADPASDLLPKQSKRS